MKTPKYEYYLYTWGGFYNKEYQSIHKEVSGSKWFDTEVERTTYINKLRTIEKELNARVLAISTYEGFYCRTKTICHRVVEYKGKQYYTTFDLKIGYPYDHAKYWITYKWYPGFNDYPLGKDHDYELDPVFIVQEWITGAFIFDKED